MSDEVVASPARRGVLFWLSAAWLAVVGFAAIAADLVAPHPDELHTTEAGRAPSWRYPFGTSKIGHDMLARCIHGSRLVLVVMLVATAVGLVVGGGLGVVAGYARGWVERAVLVVVDAWIAVPSFMALLAVVTYVGRDVWVIALALGLVTAPMFARVARTATRAVADSDYVMAARMLGATHRRVVRREVLPNIVLPVGAYAFVAMGMAMLMEGTLTFLGFGLNLRQVTWGALVQEGQRDLRTHPWLALIPAALFFCTILALNVVGDRLATHLERVRVGVSRRAVAPAAMREDAAPLPLSPDAALRLEGVAVALDTDAGPVHAVRGVDLVLRAGATTALVGESGSGKTMLARSILQVLPPVARASGRVWFDGRDLAVLDEPALRQVRGRRVSMVFQDPMTALDPVVRVGDQVAELLRVHLGSSRREARRRAVELLTEVGVGDAPRRARQYPHQLSGGLRQRVAIAMALACEPSVLVADEPTSALDVTVQAQILDLLARLQRERGLTVLLVTHDLGIVAGSSDEVAVMYAGRIVERGTTRSVFEAPAMPYTQALLAAVPRLDAPSHVRVRGIAGQPPDPHAVPPGCAYAPRCARADDHCRAERPELSGTLAHEAACFHPGADVPAHTA